MRTFARTPKFIQRPDRADSAEPDRIVAEPRPDTSLVGDQRPANDRRVIPSARSTELDRGEDNAPTGGVAAIGHRFARIQVGRPSRGLSTGLVVPSIARNPISEHPSEDDIALGGGEPLGPTTRARLESIIGARLGNVRIHRGAAAERATAAVGAPAFAVGQNIVLGASAGSAAPEAGRSSPRRGPPTVAELLLAHEAAHTVQQSGAAMPVLRPPVEARRAPPVDAFLAQPLLRLPRTDPGGAAERQAEAAARGYERPTAGAPLAIAAAPTAPADLLPPMKRFKDLWREFEQARAALDSLKATAVARELATGQHDFDDILNHGIDVVNWLQHHGEPDLAATMLNEVRSVWMVQFVSLNATLPSRGVLSWSASDPGALIALGKDAARAGQHDRAFEYFGVANEILSYYALESSKARMKVLDSESADDALAAQGVGNDPAREAIRGALTLPRMIGRGLQYSDLKSIYDQMREIYGFYSVLEREALAAGDATAAAEARTKSDELHRAIKEKFTWGGTQKAGAIGQEIFDPVEIAEVGYTDTRRGPGLTLYGANSAETTLTQLPGLPSPKEVGNNVQYQNLGAMQSALMAQTDFQAEIARQPEVRKAFGDAPIDLGDTVKRQKVWQIMYGVFKQSGAGALGSLMALIGRYLQAYTIHTMYNVRDWGTNYLDSDLPTDLAGRAEKDCGVYALTVAWDVYQTVKRGDPKLDVSFDLTTMLEHVTLVITDKATGEYYVVNNDQVSPPQKGDPLTQVAPQYGAIRGLAHTVGPAVTVALGSTKDSRTKFHDDAWTRYLAAVDWGLKLDIPPDVARLEKTDPAAYAQRVLAIEKARYEGFYRDQEIFDREAKVLDSLVDGLAPVAGDPARLARELEPVVDKAGALTLLFDRLGPSAGVSAGSAKTRALLPRQAQYLFTMEPGHAVHPIARVALGILHLQALGGTLTPKEDALAKYCALVPMFKQQMDVYQSAGALGKF